LGPGGPSGRVSEIRWRYTAIETRAWETVIVPNSVLMKGQVIVQGRRTGEPVQLRRAFELYVDFRTPPTEVVAAILRELSTDPVANMAIEPPPQVLFTGIRDSYAVYTVRYWLTDLAVDEITDSAVRIRAYFALRRAGIPLSIPAQALFVTAETEDRRARKGRRGARPPAGRPGRGRSVHAARRRRARHPGRGAPPRALRRRRDRDPRGRARLGLYLITRGRAVVQLGTGERARQVAELGAGQFFGEMSLMTGAARSATVVAATDLECYRIDKDVFQTLIAARPEIADQIAEVLAARREALESARGQRAATSRADVKADLVDRIRGFFGLRG
jgi:hypothetical protein